MNWRNLKILKSLKKDLMTMTYVNFNDDGSEKREEENECGGLFDHLPDLIMSWIAFSSMVPNSL